MRDLSKVEIQIIQQSLSNKGIRYWDVQLEILDHMSSSIEERMNQDEKHCFKSALKDELEKWPEKNLQTLIKRKNWSLQWYWLKRSGNYFLTYFKWPKIGLTVLLFTLITSILRNPYIFEKVHIVLLATSEIIYLIALIYWFYREYEESHSYPPPLLSVTAYNRVIYGFPSLFLFYHTFYNQNPPGFSEQSVIGMAVVISLLIVIIHATFLVFPKWLKEDVKKNYEHLGISIS